MELILWRHADAEDGIRDSERKLTSKGVKQAGRMAKWLLPRIGEDVVILASPAKRAQQTARALNRDFQTVDEIGLAATPHDILAAAGWTENHSADHRRCGASADFGRNGGRRAGRSESAVAS